MSKKVQMRLLFLLLGVLLFIACMYSFINSDNVTIKGIIMLASLLIIGVCSRDIANEFILNKYIALKLVGGKTLDKERDASVKNRSESKTNMIVTMLWAIVIFAAIFINANIVIVIVTIITTIIVQAFLGAYLYIYYDKKYDKFEIK